MRTALIQMNSRTDTAENLAALEALVRDAHAEAAPELVVTPEYTSFLGGSRAALRAAAEPLPGGPSWQLGAALAAELGITLHLGSILEADGDRIYNTALIFGPDGTEHARYRKIHMLEVETASGRSYREADLLTAGTEIVTYPLGAWTVGVSICFDLRFGGLYGRLRDAGAEILTIPAAFNADTGRAHWEVLCRARAIETQSYVLAPGQTGTHPQPSGDRPCHGNSLIIDPWGEILARAPDGPGWIAAELDRAHLRGIRQRMPLVPGSGF